MMIAMAMACEPRLIIADEPTTALDVMVQAQVLDLLRGVVQDTGVGLMIISHDLSVLADRVRRRRGDVRRPGHQHGPARDVFKDPVHPYTRALSGAFPTIGDVSSRFAPSGLAGDPPFPGDLPSGCPFHPRCSAAVESVQPST